MNVNSATSFGAVLRRQRVKAGLTQEALAEAANLSARAISDLERGVNHTPRKDTVQMLAEALALPAAERDRFLALARPAAGTRPPEPRPPALRHSTLPAQPTPFIGRVAEVAAVGALLKHPDTHLLTITGPAGVGKTRLALRVAAELIAGLADGVVFVPLAAITRPELVVSSLAHALGLREESGPALPARVQDYLGDRELLLILDNFEQVLVAAPLVSEILAGAPQVKVLVTSRAPLHLRGEKEISLPPLQLPNSDGAAEVARLAQYDAVALFVTRARDAKPDFVLTAENGPAIAEICRRLDGLPLALELAAARIKILPPQSLLTRLDKRLGLLTGGARDLPVRHQTLRAAIAWSYDLLTPAEQALFQQLAVFVGGCTLEAAAAVCAPPAAGAADILDGLSALVDQSLLWHQDVDGAPRFRMLETIREFALDALEGSGAAAAGRERHSRYFLTLAEQAELALQQSEQRRWLNQLAEEQDNFRAALGWTLGGPRPAGAAQALRTAVALWRFWYIRGHLSEGRRWLETALAQTPDLATPLRGIALRRAGVLAHDQGDYAAAQTWYTESLALARALDDPPGVAACLISLGVLANNQGEYGRAQGLLQESLALRQALGDQRGIAGALNNLGNLAFDQGEYAEAHRLYAESLALFQRLGDRQHTATVLNNLGQVARCQGALPTAQTLHSAALTIKRELGDQEGIASSLTSLGHLARLSAAYDDAWRLYGESLAIFRALEDRAGIGASLGHLGQVARLQGDPTAAAGLLARSLQLLQPLGDKRGIARGLLGLAAIALADPGAAGAERATRLLGAVEALQRALGAPLDPADQAELQDQVATAQARLDATAFAAAWAVGGALPPAQLVQEALDARL